MCMTETAAVVSYTLAFFMEKEGINSTFHAVGDLSCKMFKIASGNKIVTLLL